MKKCSMPPHPSFVPQASPEIQAAVEAMQTLLPRVNLTTHVYAEATADAKKQAFARQYHLTERQSTHVCFERLLGARSCRQRTCNPWNLFAGFDHGSEWVREDYTVCIVSQPYGITHSALMQMAQACEQYGIEVRLDARLSWHFPGWTTAVIYTKTGTRL